MKSDQPAYTSLTLPGELFGHSLEGHPTSAWQRLDDHLNTVADLASKFAGKFDSADWGWLAGILHDIGKADERFQSYLRRENHIDDEQYDINDSSRVNHSSAGAALAEQWLSQPKRPLGRALSYIIAGHHAGLPDYSVSDGGNGALEKRLEEGERNLAKISNLLHLLEKSRVPPAGLPKFLKAKNFHFWVRVVFSCLVDADYLDTEAFMDQGRASNRKRDYELKSLKDKLDIHLEQLSTKSLESKVNSTRQKILAACRFAASKPSGLFSLSVPTGGGKTLSALSFALDHALQHGKERVVYVIPYTSIIEQTGRVLSEIFGEENVVEHHSNLDPDRETLRSTLASENWDAPIVVTTNVQFFESLFASRTSRCRKLHNLVNSVVILDEAQLVPPEKLDPCVSALNELTRNYRTTVVLSTATQPAFSGLDLVSEIVPPELDLYSELSRVEVKFPQTLEQRCNWPDLAHELTKYDQVLCIVNSRKDCYDLFNLMPEGSLHLSTLMCGEHRSNVIQALKRSLLANDVVRVVSTQLVEAGVDIDFPRVYRALCGLDSIVQSAGRCNREGRLPEKGIVTVFVPPTKIPSGLLQKGEVSTRELFSEGDCLFETASSLARYFKVFYAKVNSCGEEYLKKLTPTCSELLDISFRTVGTEFKLIDNGERKSVFVRYHRGEQLIEQLRRSGPNRGLMRKLQRFSVSLHARQAHKMFEVGLLEEPWSGFLAQSSACRYDETIGLEVFRDNTSAEDFIV